MTNREFTATRTLLANAMATAGAELMEYMGVGAALAAIPNTEPPKYVIAGTLAMIGKLLPAPAAAGIEGLVRYDHLGTLMVPDQTGNYFLVADVERLLAQAGVTAEPAEVLTVPKAIMNIEVDPRQSDEYKRGHRDARHSAADLVLEFADKLAALAQVPAAEVRAQAGVISAGEYDREADVMYITIKTPATGLSTELKTIGTSVQIAQSGTAGKAIEVRAAWISVADRLPEDEEPVLAYGAKRTEWAVMQRISGDWNIETASDFHSSYAPKYWMPLPTPPSTADSAGTGAMGEGADRA